MRHPLNNFATGGMAVAPGVSGSPWLPDLAARRPRARVRTAGSGVLRTIRAPIPRSGGICGY